MPFGQYVPGPPGIRSAKIARAKVVFRGGFYPDILPGGRTIDATKSRDPTNTDDVTVLQAGLLMGKEGSGGNLPGGYAPSIIGTTTGAMAIGDTTITVGANTVTELVRRIGASGTFKITGPASAAGVVVGEVITYSAASGTTITCTAGINAYISGSFIRPTDGSEEPLTFINDGFGVPVVDYDGSTLTTVQYNEFPISGHLYGASLVNWPTDTSLQQWIINRLCDVGGGKFIFDTEY